MSSSLADLQKERGFPHPSRKKKVLKFKRESTCCSAETQGGYARHGPSPLTSRAPNPGSIVFDNLIGELGGTVSLDKRNGIG
jgi:hypothetical protein